MCGIAGRVNLEAPVDRGQLFRMTDLVGHRGPDDHGYHLRQRVGLGHRRLSIVDVSGGHQPLANEDGSVWVVFNGEIYNHLELRRELQGRGHRFRTRSDTEVLVHGYEEWGADVATRLRGMFAFAIWDDRGQALTLVRDRLGIKPLYWSQLGSDLVFASEAKALLAVPEVDGTVDDEALAAYLALRYVPAPLTLFRGVRKLPPATILRWHRGLVSLRSYWDLGELPVRDDVPPTEVEAAHRLSELVDESVRLRLMSEVPVGAFLSGGIDSSIVTEAVQRAGDHRGAFKTFSVGYTGPDTRADDELIEARATAHALGTEHHETRVSVEQAARALPDLVWHLDEPVADPACVPLWFLSKLARREGVIVVLSGEGADEVLGGYTIYQRQLLAERLRTLGLGAPAGALLQLLSRAPLGSGVRGRLSRVARLLGTPLEDGYQGVARALDDSLRAQLCGADGLPSAATAILKTHYAQSRGMTPLRRMLHLDARVWLPDDLLVKADKMTMAHGLELRVPLLDHKLVELCWSLPDQMKVRGGVGKWLLRRIAERRVPRAVLTRKKRGFTTPTAAWLRGGLRDLLVDALFAGRSLSRARFDLELLRGMVTRHAAGEDLTAELWPLLVLELWHERLQQRPAAPPNPQPLIPDVTEPVHVAS